jgi:hypothetical protein
MARAEVRELLAFMTSVCFATFCLRYIDADVTDMEGELGTASALERLATVAVGSVEGWRLLARIVRHTLVVLEETDDARTLIVRALYDDIMAHADRTAALTRQIGE